MLVTVTDANNQFVSYTCRLAGITFASVNRVSVLKLFGREPQLGPLSRPSLIGADNEWIEMYSDSGNICSGVYRITQRVSGNLVEIEVDTIGSIRLCLNSNHIQMDAKLSAQPDGIRDEFELGPGLMLLLAYNDCFAFHASAIETPEGVIVFCGESGQGKSTLARELSHGHSMRRLADDIVIWRLIDGVPRGRHVLCV